MSTSTGPAYAIKNTVNLMTIPAMLDDIRYEQKREILQSFLEDLITSYDAQKTEKEFLQHVHNYIRRGIDDKADLNNYSPYIDSLINSKIGFYYNEKRDETYARLMGFTQKSVDLFKELPIVEREVTYYNNSDSQLSHMTLEEWHDRRDLWYELDLKTRTYPSTLSVNMMNPTMSRYITLSVKALTEEWGNLVVTNDTKRYKDIFLNEYCRLVVNKTSEDIMKVLTHSFAFNRNRSTDIDYADLYDYEEHPDIIEQADKIANERLAERHIFLEG